jgi:hypothetical protein
MIVATHLPDLLSKSRAAPGETLRHGDKFKKNLCVSVAQWQIKGIE